MVVVYGNKMCDNRINDWVSFQNQDKQTPIMQIFNWIFILWCLNGWKYRRIVDCSRFKV